MSERRMRVKVKQRDGNGKSTQTDLSVFRFILRYAAIPAERVRLVERLPDKEMANGLSANL